MSSITQLFSGVFKKTPESSSGETSSKADKQALPSWSRSVEGAQAAGFDLEITFPDKERLAACLKNTDVFKKDSYCEEKGFVDDAAAFFANKTLVPLGVWMGAECVVDDASKKMATSPFLTKLLVLSLGSCHNCKPLNPVIPTDDPHK
jgi:hypothetical protein